MLLDLYGALLSDSGRQMMDLYYNEDLSLAEIAAEKKMSRQAVSGSLQKQRRLLDRYEAALTLLKKEARVRRGLDQLDSLLTTDNISQARKEIARLRSDLVGE